MKLRLYKFTLAGIGMLMLAGCESALDRYPKDKLTPDTFFRNATECELRHPTSTESLPTSYPKPVLYLKY